MIYSHGILQTRYCPPVRQDAVENRKRLFFSYVHCENLVILSCCFCFFTFEYNKTVFVTSYWTTRTSAHIFLVPLNSLINPVSELKASWLYPLCQSLQRHGTFCHTLFIVESLQQVLHFLPFSLPLSPSPSTKPPQPQSGADVVRIPNFLLLLSARHFWKRKAGQKIIGRTSYKCECGRRRTWVCWGCEPDHWASPRPPHLTIVWHFSGCHNNHNTLLSMSWHNAAHNYSSASSDSAEKKP